MSEISHELLKKIHRAVPERSRNELEKIVGEDFMKWGEGNISEFQRKKARRIMSSDFPTIDEKDETYQTMMEIETLVVTSGYRTWRNIMESDIMESIRFAAWPQMFWYPKRANLVLVWDAEDLYSMGLLD